MKVLGYDVETYEEGCMRSACGTIHVWHRKADAYGDEVWVLDVHVNAYSHVTMNGPTLEKAESAAAGAIRVTIQDATVALKGVP